MKKIIFPLLMLLSIVVSQEASAALLSWTSIPAAVAGDTVSGDSNAAPNILVGDYNFGSGRTVTHDWYFSLVPATSVKTFFAIQFEGEILSAKLNGSEIVSGTTTSLSAGVHKLSLALNAINGDHEHITIRASVVPVPAAIWLFGSALMGLVGVSRRKVSGLAA